MLSRFYTFSIRTKVLILLTVGMSAFIIIGGMSYLFTNKNVNNIEDIDTYKLPLSILHTENLTLIEHLMGDFSDAAITNEADKLHKTVHSKEKLIQNLDQILEYGVDVEYLKEMVENYFVHAYSLTSDLLNNKGEIQLDQAQEVQKDSKEILLVFQELKKASDEALMKSLKNISDDSKSFFTNSLIISAIGFLLILFVGVLIYYNINKRFKTIIKLVENLAVENPDFSLKLEDKQNDELSKLVSLFNKISLKLENVNETLKQEVKQAIEKTKQQEQKLIQQSRLAQMGEMISMIAHQWRQPLNGLNAIGMSLDLQLNAKEPNRERIDQMIDQIEIYTEHMSDTIEDFSNFFRPNKEKAITNFEALVKNSLRLIDASIKSSEIEIIIEKEKVNSFVTYQNELIQVILNIIRNAEEALKESEVENPCIKISIYTRNNKNILEIRDNAGGIDENIIGNVFDPYFSTKSKKMGTGIGLYMSKIIITEHCDGNLSVANDAHGAVFTIAL